MREDVAVFFDIGDTLASAVLEANRLARLEVYPFVLDVLGRLRAGSEGVSVSLGLISTGDESAARMNAVLAEAGLADLVDVDLCLFSSVEALDKSQPAFFSPCQGPSRATRLSMCLCRREPDERAVAASVGFRVSPHPLHALHLAESELFGPLGT